MHRAIKAALEDARVAYREIFHATLGVPIRGPADVAHALDLPIGQISKTLLLRSGGLCFAVLPCKNRLDFTALGNAIGSRCTLATKRELEEEVGYPSGSVSPLGTRKIPVYIDLQLMRFTALIVGGGEIGSEVELSSLDFVRLTNAQILPLSET